MPSISEYLVAFVLTVLIETPVYLVSVGLAARIRLPVGTGDRVAADVPWIQRGSLTDGLTTSLVANVTTHPLAFLVVGPILVMTLGGTIALIVIEAVVIVVEAAIVRARHGDLSFGLIAAGVANAVSFGIGWLLVR